MMEKKIDRCAHEIKIKKVKKKRRKKERKSKNNMRRVGEKKRYLF